MIHRQNVIVLLILIFTLSSSLAFGQMPRTAKNRLGVDVVTIKGGKRLYGVVMPHANQSELSMAIERNWLETTHPKLYQSFRTSEIAANRESHRKLNQRIDNWLQKRVDDGLLSTFLQDEKKRFQKENENATIAKKFIVVAIPKDQVGNVYLQTPQRRKIVGLAWQNGLANTTTTSTTILKKRLQEKQVDVEKEQVNLASELPSMDQTDKQWSAKVALVEHVLRPSLEYQGTGTTLFKKGEQLDEGALLGQLLGNGNGLVDQLAEQLGLGNQSSKDDSDWWKTARQGAERDGFSGVFVVRMKQDYTSPEVAVDGHFFARNLDGTWFEVIRLRAVSDVNNESQQTLERLRQEPQVKQIFDTLGGLGLSGGNAQLELALRHGAATQTSLTKVRSQFDEFLANYTQQLDVPAVPVK